MMSPTDPNVVSGSNVGKLAQPESASAAAQVGIRNLLRIFMLYSLDIG